jgi:hypothetical protein
MAMKRCPTGVAEEVIMRIALEIWEIPVLVVRPARGYFAEDTT